MNRDCIIAGWGAVSPAGWTSRELVEAVLEKQELPVVIEKRQPEAPEMACRLVPPLASPPAWLRQPRLRRASPILVPETVFNAPSSHVAALLASPALNNTLVSDAGGFLAALDMAVQWLDEGNVSDCLVIAAEEHDWLSGEALGLFPGQPIASEGAAALWLRQDDAEPGSLVVEQITQAWAITNHLPRADAIQRLRTELDAPDSAALVSAISGSSAWDRPHEAAFSDWSGPRHDLQPQFGHPFSALGGWQSVLACELLHRRLAADTVVTADSGACQAQAAWLRRLP